MNANTSHLRMMRDRAVGSVELFSSLLMNTSCTRSDRLSLSSQLEARSRARIV
mgnify:CR=1 FL=1